jgi:Fur family peroxide stress response transcriptional regulator
MKIEGSFEDAINALREAGLRATGPRVAILRALRDERTHPTAERIHASLSGHLPSLSLSTVYSTLETFLSAGLCRRVSPNGTRMRVDGNLSDHDHAVCSACHRIFDVDRSANELKVPPSQLPGGLEVHAVRVEYDVTCQTCRNKSAAPNRSMLKSPK